MITDGGPDTITESPGCTAEADNEVPSRTRPMPEVVMNNLSPFTVIDHFGIVEPRE